MSDPVMQAMQATAERIQRLSDEHWWALDPSCTLMAGGAWVGPAGKRFGDEVHSRQRELRAMLANAVASAKHELAKAK